MTELLKQNIAKHISLSDKEMESFCNLFKKKTVKKKNFLLREGEVCKFEGFVTKGTFRLYHIDKNGAEQILYFAIENWWITDIDSFTNEKPSQLFIEAIEDSTVVSISRDNLEKMFSSSNRFERLGRLVIIEWLVQQCEWENARVRLSPKERFLYFVKKQPQLVKRVPQKQLASFLSIKPETFSRYKHFITATDNLEIQ